jgi:hypothetical protein
VERRADPDISTQLIAAAQSHSCNQVLFRGQNVHVGLGAGINDRLRALGHGIEALGGRLHGECVALGMIPMTTGDAKDRLINLLGVLGLKTADEYSLDEALGFIKHDKKASGEFVHAVVVDKIGHGKIEKLAFSDLSERIRKNV